MLKSHSMLKQQVESSEKLIALLAEKVVTMISSSANKIKEFEEIQIGHQAKLVEIDTKQKELIHKVNQLKHNTSQGQGSHTPRSKRRQLDQGGNGSGGGGGLGSGGYSSTNFSADSHALDNAMNHNRLESIEQAVEASRQVILDQLRETKLEVDSVWGEIRRDNDLNQKR